MTNQYSELWEFLNICVFNYWLKLFGLEGIKDVVCTKDGVAIHCEWDDINDTAYPFRCSYHDLFSVDSGLMEFVGWKDYDRRGLFDVEWGWPSQVSWHYMIMAGTTKEDQIKYFLENALLPTQD